MMKNEIIYLIINIILIFMKKLRFSINKFEDEKILFGNDDKNNNINFDINMNYIIKLKNKFECHKSQIIIGIIDIYENIM